MLRLSHLLVCTILFGYAPFATATSVDPQISVGDPSSGTPVFSETFPLSSDVHGGGILSFTNDSGITWTTLDFFVTLPSDDTITCSSKWYSFCNYTTTSAGNGKSVFDIGFEQPFQAGILPGASFTINLNDPYEPPNGDKGSWGPNTAIEAIANFDIPEPAAWNLAGVGLLCLAMVGYCRRSA